MAAAPAALAPAPDEEDSQEKMVNCRGLSDLLRIAVMIIGTLLADLLNAYAAVFVAGHVFADDPEILAAVRLCCTEFLSCSPLLFAFN